ncbi:uncharacterized protein BDZ99DRAFT_388593 [Mytilinidion resinicola]|uniref:LsmAD domain-containing protein n=1 Tax=Mytilinidion resinicola TaxID=574789 RepID=A0A6A6YMF7_9PEZI|nr:uncharacterized protein BDZ99DRAFT_388593 [Mytilinidion resinicola]KAF2809728.1 hypothetical protein BDZ99DRAFT_388593 [Mytilinidion resinicola]
MSSSGKSDAARKQAGSPLDGNQRKPPPQQKAWGQGTNPITQRASNANNSNGVANPSKATPAAQGPPSSSNESHSYMKHMNDRMMFLLASLTGLPTNFTLKNGEKYTGVFSGTSLDPSEMRYVFKMVKRVQTTGDQQVNGASEISDDYVGVGDNHVMTCDIGDVAHLNVANVVLDKTRARPQNGVSSFRTDADISGNLAIRERNLQRWEPSSDAHEGLTLEESGKATWDQFATNQQRFGVESTYDESIYTTTIDRSNPLYQERAARAERIAREIETSSTLNSHVNEERGNANVDDSGVDEEEKYSGVRRDFPPLPSGQPGRYTAPAKRAPTGAPSVPSVPVDPAIISSQIARPVSTSTKPPAAADSSGTEKRPTPEAAKAEPSIPATVEVPKGPIDSKNAASKPLSESAQKLTAALKPPGAGVPALRKVGRGDNATANVEHDLLDSFKQFSATEKLRVQERQRSMARESKAVKLNDLKKFSQNFKLNTPVPTDLVPILAKDEGKQKHIVEKALKAVQEQKSTPPKPATVVADQKAPRPANAKPDPVHTSPSADRQAMPRQRPNQNYNSVPMRGAGGNHIQNQNTNQPPPRSGTGTGLLSQRLAVTQQQHRAGTSQYNVPQPVPIQDMRIVAPTGPSANSSGIPTPTSTASTRFNVRAADFKPNPNANAFTPGGNPSAGSSPRPNSAASRPEPRKTPIIPITSFFGNQKPSGETLPFDDAFNPIKRMLKEVQDENKTKDFAANGGIPQAYRTPPTWDVPDANKEKNHVEMFERPTPPQPISAPHTALGNGPIPHQHQLPPHLQGPQNMQQAHNPQQTPQHRAVQPHHNQNGPHHFDGGHHMQFSQSNSSVHPSPRAMPPYMYNGQPQAMPVFQQPPMQFGMSPNMHPAGMRGQPGFPNGPPAMGGHMMTNQTSAGPYMGMPQNPQMHMYSPGPQPAFPHYPQQMTAPPGANSFPNSPRPGAPMMSHQGSQQGHQQQPVIYMQPNGQVGPQMFAQMPQGPMTPMRGPYPQPHQPHYGSPHQHNQYPQQPHRGTPSASYSQPMMQQHSQQHSMPPQGPTPTGPAAHGPEGGEEVK